MKASDFRSATGVSRETLDRLSAYVELLIRWQKKINLVSHNSLDDIWGRHIFDSAQLLDHVESGDVIDLGTGAGFPGLVLSIMGVTGMSLVESDGRKCVFLREAIRVTGSDAKVLESRVELLDIPPPKLIVSRAFAPLERLLRLAERLIGPATRLVLLKGQGVEYEISMATSSCKVSYRLAPSRSDRSGRILLIDGVSYGTT
ncbi:MAG: 16S rRNA (guanine(527)-N(7))-methyltransferase RsmG [Alphaproteobacteria bacterium]|nr:16S rRNA (guanine(527)-N(7))-methyltransferase RsmG [Alphaproteobacteria bacterium]